MSENKDSTINIIPVNPEHVNQDNTSNSKQNFNVNAHNPSLVSKAHTEHLVSGRKSNYESVRFLYENNYVGARRSIKI